MVVEEAGEKKEQEEVEAAATQDGPLVRDGGGEDRVKCDSHS